MDRAQRDGDGPGRQSLRASVAGAVAAALLTALVFAGSDALRNFDAALIGYATATIVLTFGVVYRYAMWVQTPPSHRYLLKGWSAFFSMRNWSLVFPLGMYSVATTKMIAAVGLPFGGWIPWAAFWAAAVAWTITFFGMLAAERPGPRHR
jgi:tellurite resistance protein TehA-like permease